jgi:hypothetical protein
LYEKDAKGETQLIAILATHVDDIKGGGTDASTAYLLKGLTAAFGKLKVSHRNFEHCGLMYSQTAEGIKISQAHYAQQLRPIPLAGLNVADIDTKLTEPQIRMFQSILGGLSWLVQCRPDLCIYVGALQRIATKATTGHVLKINQLVRYVRKRDCFLFFPAMKAPFKIGCISDAAFRRESIAGLSMRGAIICVMEDRPLLAGQITKIHWIEYYARKQRRVVRSTFSAELNAAADAYEVSRLISLTLSSLFLPASCTARSLGSLEAQGKLPFSIDLYIDCRSILDS